MRKTIAMLVTHFERTCTPDYKILVINENGNLIESRMIYNYDDMKFDSYINELKEVYKEHNPYIIGLGLDITGQYCPLIIIEPCTDVGGITKVIR